MADERDGAGAPHLRRTVSWNREVDAKQNRCSSLPFFSFLDRTEIKEIVVGNMNPHTRRLYRPVPSAQAKTTSSSSSQTPRELNPGGDPSQEKAFLKQFSKGLTQTNTLDKFVTVASRAKRSSSEALHLPVSHRARRSFKVPTAHEGAARDVPVLTVAR